MTHFMKHVVLPALAPVAVLCLYFTPVLLFGCVARGLLALTIVLISSLFAIVTALIGLRAKLLGDPSSNWWLISTAMFTLPLMLVLGPLG